MRNFTGIILGLGLLVSLPAMGKVNNGLREEVKNFRSIAHAICKGELKEAGMTGIHGKAFKTAVPGSKAASKAAPNNNMKAQTMKTFGWWRDNWMPEDTYSYTYDTAGNIIVELVKDEAGYYSRTVSEYNDNGMVTFKETKTSSDGVNYENNMKTELEYDHILTDVITKRTEWIWLDDEWQLKGNNYKRVFNRNDKGDVESVVIEVLYEGEYDPTQRLLITYGENGEAVEMAEEILDYNGKEFFWEEGAKVTDIVWERTDGQLYNIEEIFSGNNRVKSCHMIDGDGIEMDMNVEYAQDSDDYTASISMVMDGMTVTGVLEYTELENGGGRMHMELGFMGMVVMSITEEIQNDAWGLTTLQKVEESGYGETYAEGMRGEVEYDAEGRPATYTISEFYTDEDTGEVVSEYVIRAEYSDYVDVTTAVESVAAEDVVTGRYYNLQGMPVSAPEKGQIVVKDGRLSIKY